MNKKRLFILFNLLFLSACSSNKNSDVFDSQIISNPSNISIVEESNNTGNSDILSEISSEKESETSINEEISSTDNSDSSNCDSDGFLPDHKPKK